MLLHEFIELLLTVVHTKDEAGTARSSIDSFALYSLPVLYSHLSLLSISILLSTPILLYFLSYSLRSM